MVDEGIAGMMTFFFSPPPGRLLGACGQWDERWSEDKLDFRLGVGGRLIFRAPEFVRLVVVLGVDCSPFLIRRWAETRYVERYGDVWGKGKRGERTTSGRRLDLYAFPPHTQ